MEMSAECVYVLAASVMDVSVLVFAVVLVVLAVRPCRGKIITIKALQGSH
jgi:hypothetical protein